MPNGEVMINRGSGFYRVNGAQQINAGDVIMINDGDARVSCADGAVSTIVPGKIYTVGESPCEEFNSDAVGGNGADAVDGADVGGAGVGGALGGAAAGGAAGGVAGISTVGLVAGGLAIAGGVAAAAAAKQNSKEKAASP